MSIALIDYGCHSFIYRLAENLRMKNLQVSYLVNGSLESPNLTSIKSWVTTSPDVVREITCAKPYGKMGMKDRLRGELEWGKRCVTVLEELRPTAIIASCIPLTAVTGIHRWARANDVLFIYWLQDIQSRAIHDLLGRKLGLPGRTLGAFAHLWEQEILEDSDMVITIAPSHENELPASIRKNGRHALLENWPNLEEFPQHPVSNAWSVAHGLDRTKNIVYSGTLGMKHDLAMFVALAERFQSRADVRIVIVSSGQAATKIQERAKALGLVNVVVLPFQPYPDVPKVLASAKVLIAPLEKSAGAFCVPSKILSYLCAGRPMVVAIDENNLAAQMIRRARAGQVVPPGNSEEFLASVEHLIDNELASHSAGVRARVFAEANFSLENIVGRFLGILHRVDPALT